VTPPAQSEGREGKPTHICLDCGAVGYAGGYHDHGDGEAGDTASIAAVLKQLEKAGDVLDEVDSLRAENERLREALAYEATVVEAQALDAKALGKGRRECLEQAVKRMRAVALGAEHPRPGGPRSELARLASLPAAGQEAGG
jgi:hypothetical protein